MSRKQLFGVAAVLVLLIGVWLLFRFAVAPEPRPTAPQTGVIGGPAAPGDQAEPPSDARVEGDVVYTPRDLEIFQETMARAAAERLDTLPIGEIIVRVARPFVGEPYVPHTLELPGPERLVVNLRELDCVTYVEVALALARTIRAGSDSFADFTEELRRIRYRSGRLDGYPSRLHYFSDWIADNQSLGLIRDITSDLGGRRVDEPIDFMSRNAEAYAKLVEQPAYVDEIRRTEERLSTRPRYMIPESDVGAVADRIRNGDIIAATSSLQGLDIAHTGFAIWIDGRLHLMHAPLVGHSLEISERPLADRLLRIRGQDGLMVSRPL